MHSFTRLLLVLLPAISFSHAEVVKKTTPEPKEEVKKDTPPPAAVSTVSIDDLSGFETYPKQVQSLVQSALALTRLELGYLFGSHEPSKGGMDCSGTVYHVLKFQGLKDVPRQSDEMCQWVEKKTQLHLTPTATSFDSTEFTDLKPGDLLFWTNTTETKRKLPVTHVMIYLGKLKKTGKPTVFGASDGRSFAGQRRSGVSVFDFHLPKAESTTRFYGYGPAPGLQPVEAKPVIATTTPPPIEKPAPTPAPAAPPAAAEKPAVTKEEVRKAVASVPGAKAETKPEPKKTVVAETKPKETPTVSTKPKTTTVKKSSPPSTTTTKKKSTPPPPPKSEIERKIDNAVNSVRRFLGR